MKQTLVRKENQIYLARILSDDSFFEMITDRSGKMIAFQGSAKQAMADLKGTEHPIFTTLKKVAGIE